MAAILKIQYDVTNTPPIVGFLRKFEDGCKMTYVKIETGKKITIRRSSVFLNRKWFYLSRGLTYFIEIWFGNRFPAF